MISWTFGTFSSIFWGTFCIKSTVGSSFPSRVVEVSVCGWPCWTLPMATTVGEAYDLLGDDSGDLWWYIPRYHDNSWYIPKFYGLKYGKTSIFWDPDTRKIIPFPMVNGPKELALCFFFKISCALLAFTCISSDNFLSNELPVRLPMWSRSTFLSERSVFILF